MSKIIDKQNQIAVTSKQAKKLYPSCNYLLIDTVHYENTITGILYAISEEPNTLLNLVKLEQELQKQGHKTFIGGDYYPNCIFDYIQIIKE